MHVNSFVFAGLSALITHLKKVKKDKSREERDVEVGEREGEGGRERESKTHPTGYKVITCPTRSHTAVHTHLSLNIPAL